MGFDKNIIYCNKTGFFSLLITLFLISFPRSWSLYPLVFFLVCGLFLWVFNFKNLKTSFLNKLNYLLPLIIYFFIHLISLLLQKGNILLIEKILIFMFVPLLGFPVFNSEFFKINIIYLKISFIAGITIILFYLIFNAIYSVYRVIPDDYTFIEFLSLMKERFFGSYISVLEHPTYLSMKILWCLLIFLIIPSELKIKRNLIIFFFLLFSVFLFFLASKAAIILWAILTVILMVKWPTKKIGKIIVIMFFVPIFTLFVGISINNITRIKGFISDKKSALNKEKIDWKNFDLRTREWFSAIQIIREKPLSGCGLVKVEDRMVEEYLKNGWKEEAKLRYNAHNQFLETQMTFGIPGTLSLLWMLFNPLIFRKRLKYPLLATAFVIMISYFLLFESMLVRQWGIMFFTLFYCILMFSEKDEKDNQTGLKFY